MSNKSEKDFFADLPKELKLEIEIAIDTAICPKCNQKYTDDDFEFLICSKCGYSVTDQSFIKIEQTHEF